MMNRSRPRMKKSQSKMPQEARSWMMYYWMITNTTTTSYTRKNFLKTATYLTQLTWQTSSMSMAEGEATKTKER